MKPQRLEEGEVNELAKKGGVLAKETREDEAVVLVQRYIRGHQARAQVSKLREHKQDTEAVRTHAPGTDRDAAKDLISASNGNAESQPGTNEPEPAENAKVKEMESKMSPFQYSPQGERNPQLERRPAVTLDTGVRYTGDW